MPTTMPSSPFYQHPSLTESDISIVTKHSDTRAEVRLHVYHHPSPLVVESDADGYHVQFPGRGKPSVFANDDALIKGFRKAYNTQLERLRHWERRYVLLEQDIERWGRNISDVAHALLDASLTEAMNAYAKAATDVRAFGVRPSQVSPYRDLDLAPELFRMTVRRGHIRRARLYYRGIDIDELFLLKDNTTQIIHSGRNHGAQDIAFNASIDTLIEKFIARVENARTEALAQIDGYYLVEPNHLTLLDAVYAANEAFMTRRAERNAKARERARRKKNETEVEHHARKKKTEL